MLFQQFHPPVCSYVCVYVCITVLFTIIMYVYEYEYAQVGGGDLHSGRRPVVLAKKHQLQLYPSPSRRVRDSCPPTTQQQHRLRPSASRDMKYKLYRYVTLSRTDRPLACYLEPGQFSRSININAAAARSELFVNRCPPPRPNSLERDESTCTGGCSWRQVCLYTVHLRNNR